MAESFVIKRNDRLPDLAATLIDATEAAVNLTGSTLRFHMRPSRGGPAKVAASADIVSAAAGTVRYQWAAADTDVAGSFLGEFEVTWGDGRKQTFPNLVPIRITVTEDFG